MAVRPESIGRERLAAPRRRWCPAALLGALLVLSFAGCEKAMQNMYQQPRYDPLESAKLFPNRSSSRTPPKESLALHTGGLAESSGGRRGAEVPLPESAAPVYPILRTASISQGNSSSVPWVPDLSSLPIAVTAAILRRGEERFDIYCAPCHGPAGYGNGMVVQRGFPAPPSYHTERLRTASHRHFYDVITQGYGAMYPYADRVLQNDRWAVVAYIRALQLSRHAPAELFSAADLRRLEAADD
jgi:mono/diheme cytochrome c family protein